MVDLDWYGNIVEVNLFEGIISIDKPSVEAKDKWNSKPRLGVI